MGWHVDIRSSSATSGRLAALPRTRALVDLRNANQLDQYRQRRSLAPSDHATCWSQAWRHRRSWSMLRKSSSRSAPTRSFRFTPDNNYFANSMHDLKSSRSGPQPNTRRPTTCGASTAGTAILKRCASSCLCTTMERWISKKLRATDVRSAASRRGTILLMPHEIWKSRKSQRAISRAARTEPTSPPSPPPRRRRGGRARRRGGRGIRRCRGCRCSCRRPGWSCRRAISARSASPAPPRTP